MMLDLIGTLGAALVYLVSVVVAYALGRSRHLNLRGGGLRTGESEVLGSAGGVRGRNGGWLYQAVPPHEAVPWVDQVRKLVIREAHPGDVLRVEVYRVGRMEELPDEVSS